MNFPHDVQLTTLMNNNPDNQINCIEHNLPEKGMKYLYLTEVCTGSREVMHSQILPPRFNP